MLTIRLDFRHITDCQDFYRQFAASADLPAYFGANADALWDVLTGELALPARIELYHWLQHPHPQQFNTIIATLREAADALEGELTVQIED